MVLFIFIFYYCGFLPDYVYIRWFVCSFVLIVFLLDSLMLRVYYYYHYIFIYICIRHAYTCVHYVFIYFYLSYTNTTNKWMYCSVYLMYMRTRAVVCKQSNWSELRKIWIRFGPIWWMLKRHSVAWKNVAAYAFYHGKSEIPYNIIKYIWIELTNRLPTPIWLNAIIGD